MENRNHTIQSKQFADLVKQSRKFQWAFLGPGLVVFAQAMFSLLDAPFDSTTAEHIGQRGIFALALFMLGAREAITQQLVGQAFEKSND